jgi:hypothetical protein
MRYNYYNRVCKLIVAILVFLPLTTLAQREFKEFYMRPSYWRPYDRTGVNVFETTKQEDPIPFEGLRVRLGAGFTQQFQGLKHENGFTTPTATTQLYKLTPGFNTAQANLNLDVQLADGIRLNLVTYLSARHHNEAWVKGGYIQFDKLPFKGQFWSDLMKLTTIKIGHMEINYGDAHFRRSDGGQTIYNPFIENYIADAFATEIGGEVYLQRNGLFGMIGLTNGMIKGNVDSVIATPQDDNVHKSPSIYGKGGFDKVLGEKLRIRGTASYYHNGSSGSNTLYGGDRTGSNYFMVMESQMTKDKTTGASVKNTYDAAAFSGRFNPGFTKKIDALQLNGFLKFSGLEVFGTYEKASGRSKSETTTRDMTQWAGDVVYRLGKAENLFVGARYNTVDAELAGATITKVNINRVSFSGGWFITKNIMLKGEYVEQKYKDFPTTDIRYKGKFNGYVIEAVVGF